MAAQREVVARSHSWAVVARSRVAAVACSRVAAHSLVHMVLVVEAVDHHTLWAHTAHSSLLVVPLATQPS